MKRNKIKNLIVSAVICMTVAFMSGCAGDAIKGNNAGPGEASVSGGGAVSGSSSKDGAGVKVSDADRQAADEFPS